MQSQANNCQAKFIQIKTVDPKIQFEMEKGGGKSVGK